MSYQTLELDTTLTLHPQGLKVGGVMIILNKDQSL